jgi:hypothetical protein
MADAFEGLSELIKDLTEMPKLLQGEAAKHIKAAANGLESELRRNYARQTGNLVRGIRRREKDPLNITISSRAPHVHLYEMGSYKTPNRRHKSGKSTGTMPAHPTFRPAAGKERRRLNSEYARMLRGLKARHMNGSAL